MIFSDDIPLVPLQSDDEVSEASDSEDEFTPDLVVEEVIHTPEEEEDMMAPQDLVWETADETHQPFIHPFDDSGSGVTTTLPVMSESECFKLFMSEDFVGNIAEETNKYAHHLKQQGGGRGKMQKWVNTTIPEMFTFLVTVLLMALVRKNTVKEYWSRDPMFFTPFFHTLFSQDRFLLILRSLHITDPNSIIPRDPLGKIRPVISSLTNSFKQVFTPYRKLCIDESLMLWKGRLSFRQFIPSKRSRFGIKFFLLCDVRTGYLLDMIVYTGSSSDIQLVPGLGVTGSVVTTLLRPFLGRGHALYVDNWYTSPVLFLHLFKHKTGACGTVRKGRKGLPVFKNKMKKGEVDYRKAGQLLALKWHDKRDVHLLSTMSKATVVDTGRVDYTGAPKIKPSCVMEYNGSMGAVDRFDMKNSFVDCTRKTLKWYKKVFFHLVDCAIHNAQIVHQQLTGRVTPSQVFRRELMRQLLEKYHCPRNAPTAGRLSLDNPLRLTGRHFPREVPKTTAQGDSTRRQCKVCLHTTRRPRQRKMTRVFCAPCDAALCAFPCFEEYHTLKLY